ncbi:SMI1/KNR4 family protein [Pseudomonas sp. NFXW11]|uniref:SMI1/KNR4 family protein n=1 Tax=Pseudomonas sp. NFXW11 TaxID=2819531 RepID=UPI003CEECE71
MSESELLAKSEKLKEAFVCDGYYAEPGDLNEGPGAIADLTDFSHIACFAMAGDGSPFCFDFRQDRKEPSVICWDDDYWRKISNSFEDFIQLFS